MDLLCFLPTLTEYFNFKRVIEGLASQAIGLFLTGSTQTVYTNVVHPSTHDPTRLPVTWPLIVHILLSRFITYELLRNEHYAVASARIKQSETAVAFAERLHFMALLSRNVLSNAELMNCFKQGVPDATGSPMENNLREIPASTGHDSTISNNMLWQQGQHHVHAKLLRFRIRRFRLLANVPRPFTISRTISPWLPYHLLIRRRCLLWLHKCHKIRH